MLNTIKEAKNAEKANSIQNPQKTNDDDKEIIHRKKHFKCEVCTETFIRSKHLRNHRKKKHSGEPCNNNNNKTTQAKTNACSFNLYSILQKAEEEISYSTENINPNMEIESKTDTQCTRTTNPPTPDSPHVLTPTSPSSRDRKKRKVPLSSHHSTVGTVTPHGKLRTKKGGLFKYFLGGYPHEYPPSESFYKFSLTTYKGGNHANILQLE